MTPASFPLKELGRKARGRIFSSTDTDGEGQGPSIFKLGWFFLFSFLALGLTVAVSFSCSSAATSNNLHLYSVRPAALIEGLTTPSKAAAVNGTMKRSSNNTTEDSSGADFGLASLPDRYLFGISGLCRHWNETDETRCKHRFPHVPSLLDAILEDSESPAVSDSWTRFLTSTHISTADQVSLWRRYVTAAAGLLVTSILWAFATIAFTLLLPKYLKYSVFLEVADAIMVITAAIMWTTIFNSQSDALRAAAPEDITPTMLKHILSGGPGLSMLWALTWCKLMVTPLMMLILLVIALLPVLCCFAAFAHDSDRIKVADHHDV